MTTSNPSSAAATVNTRVYSGSAWEQKVSYCRCRRVGDFIAVSGTVAADKNGVVGKGDIKAQTRYILQTIDTKLKEIGSRGLPDVVRSRAFLHNLSADFEGMAEVHGEMYRGVDPAMSAYGISSFVGPDFLVEIEADAIIQQGSK